MTRKLKEIPEREQNAAEEKEKMTDKTKPAQKEKTKNRGKENAHVFRENLQHRNSLDKYRPKCKKV